MTQRETMTENEFTLRVRQIEREGDKAFTAEWRRHLWLPLLITATSLVLIIATFNALTLDVWGIISAIFGELFIMSQTWLYWIARAEVASYSLMHALTLSDLHATAVDDDDDTEDAVS